MATTTSFKQQCPSCEAMVPIRDPGLIGRKIDCPKCKYRFVVEDPGSGEAAEAPEKNGPTGIAKDKKPANGKAAPTTERRGEGKEKPAKKKSGPSLLYAGIGLGGLALVAVVAGICYFAFGGDSSTTNTKTKPPTSGSGNKDDTAKDDEKKDDKPAIFLTDVTNYLPNDSQAVISINGEKALGSSLRKAALGTPGSFNEQSFLNT